MSTRRNSPARLGRRIITRVTAAAAAALAAGAAAAAFGAAPASAATGNWITTGWNVHQLNQLDPATAAHFFNTPSSFGTGPNASTSPINDGFAAVPALVYQSYAKFASDIASHAISSSYQWVMYDPEKWSLTPLNEQQDPVQYMRRFGQLAHQHGLKVIATPGRDLGLVTGAACPKARGEKLDQWYLSCDLAGAAAASSDLLVVQTQADTVDLAAFDQLYTGARSQAKAANPRVIVDAAVSTTYGTPAQMAAAAESAAADGIYITATAATLSTADLFLQDLQAAAY
jgi:hypothetical protein